MLSVDTADGSADEIVLIEGTVKWFDSVKGYGFVLPDSGGVDVLVHHSTLRRGGYDTLYPMARIKCTVVERPQGLQADRIVAIDNTDAQVPVGNPRPTSVLAGISNVSDFQQAHVKWFNRIRGFGFVNVEPDGDDIFVHMEVLRKAEIEALVPGQYILVKFGNGPKGLMATDVRRIDSGAQLQAEPGESQMTLHEDSPQEPPAASASPELEAPEAPQAPEKPEPEIGE
ncbi:MAG: cold shock domain-containing protein [Alphaproteobacteria bacterium]|nr:cold shock domain-containing protein [Alphaproteobacteria bacterium]